MYLFDWLMIKYFICNVLLYDEYTDEGNINFPRMRSLINRWIVKNANRLHIIKSML